MRALFQQNLGLKVFALLLAVLTWFTIRLAIQHKIALGAPALSPVATREFRRLPVQVLAEGTRGDVVQVWPKEVTARFSGEPDVLDALTERDVAAFVNLVKLGDATQAMGRIEVFCPAGVTLVSVAPRIARIERMTSGPPPSQK